MKRTIAILLAVLTTPAYGIVENHGGAIRAVNREPTGACFFIELPLSTPPNEEECLES